MTNNRSPLRPRAALLIGAALLATPAFAQDAPTQTVTPPPIAASPTTTAAPAPRIEMAPSTPIVQPAPPPGPRPEAESAAPAPERASSRQTTRRTVRAEPPARRTAPAPQPASQAPSPTPVQAAAPAETAPVAAAPVAESVTPPVTDTPPVAETSITRSTAESGQGIAWSWLLGGLVLLAAAAALLLMLRRRRADDFAEERVDELRAEDVPVAPRVNEAPLAAAPIVAAPVIAPRLDPEARALRTAEPLATAAPLGLDAVAPPHVDAELAEPADSDLAGIADAPAPVANRPWLEFGLRPVRAGTSDEEALVDVELTVGNAGDVPARDVRISTFMFADAPDSEMEDLLTGRSADTAVPPVTIAPGDGTRVDAHLAVPKGEMGRVFNPVVVAEARYTLPDGSEGRTSAAFKIGRPSPVSDGVGAIGATRPHMVDNVEAELLGAPQHA